MYSFIAWNSRILLFHNFNFYNKTSAYENSLFSVVVLTTSDPAPKRDVHCNNFLSMCTLSQLTLTLEKKGPLTIFKYQSNFVNCWEPKSENHYFKDIGPPYFRNSGIATDSF